MNHVKKPDYISDPSEWFKDKEVCAQFAKAMNWKGYPHECANEMKKLSHLIYEKFNYEYEEYC